MHVKEINFPTYEKTVGKIAVLYALLFRFLDWKLGHTTLCAQS
jgi:hypothetical protein